MLKLKAKEKLVWVAYEYYKVTIPITQTVGYIYRYKTVNDVYIFYRHVFLIVHVYRAIPVSKGRISFYIRRIDLSFPYTYLKREKQRNQQRKNTLFCLFPLFCVRIFHLASYLNILNILYKKSTLACLTHAINLRHFKK